LEFLLQTTLNDIRKYNKKISASIYFIANIQSSEIPVSTMPGIPDRGPVSSRDQNHVFFKAEEKGVIVKWAGKSDGRLEQVKNSPEKTQFMR